MTDIVERLRNWERVDIVDAHEDGALYNAAADEIERLRANLYQEEAATEALEAKLKSEGNCACSYDGVDDICMCHSPKLAAAVAEVERLREALKPFAEKFLFPDDTGYADELRAEEDWSEEANDSQVDDWLIERRWVRKARNAMEGRGSD